MSLLYHVRLVRVCASIFQSQKYLLLNEPRFASRDLVGSGDKDSGQEHKLHSENYTEDLNNTFAIVTMHDNPNIHPSNFCHSCKCKGRKNQCPNLSFDSLAAT